MTFELKLSLPEVPRVTTTVAPEYDPELDDVGALLRDVCVALEDAGASFIVQICSTKLWPVTVRTDLLVVVEQLAPVLAALEGGQPTKLEFYEQGIEKVVSLVPDRDTVLVECTDMIRKSSSEAVSAMLALGTVLDELCVLSRDFLLASEVCCSNLTKHPWFVAFSSELYRNMDLASARVLKSSPV